MKSIRLETVFPNNIEDVFNASRSIDLHVESTVETSEKAIGGRTSGLIKLGEKTRWRAKHFGFWLELEIQITKMIFPYLFIDEMIDGNFKTMKHTHEFVELNESETLMIDTFEFQSPFGILGKFVDHIYLEKYLERLLIKRNGFLKSYLAAQ